MEHVLATGLKLELFSIKGDGVCIFPFFKLYTSCWATVADSATVRLISRIRVSSAWLKRAIAFHLRIGSAILRRISRGETGDPCGTQHTNSFALIIPPRQCTFTLRLRRKEGFQRRIELGHPCACIRQGSLLCKTPSNAPCTSSVTNVDAHLWEWTSSILCITHDTRSLA